MAYSILTRTKGTTPAEPLEEWNELSGKIYELVTENASAKDLCEVICADSEFCQRVVGLAGCKRDAKIASDTVIHAILLLGMERLCDIAFTQELWRGFQ
ncbi:MAG: hypothetical protein OEZ47_07655 [Gammaproteobacteria bacterium]|nr:hypothetical protein [Gammaproteobacteria bacterium]